MKNILCAALSALLLSGFSDYSPAVSLSYQQEAPYVQTIAGARYVHVYGRKSCGNTVRMIKYLKDARIPYQFYSVDESRVSDKLHDKMRRSGMNTSHYYLPVVDVGGRLAINPPPQAVKNAYSK